MAAETALEARVQALEARLAAVEAVAEGAKRVASTLTDDHEARWSEHTRSHQRDSQAHEAEHKRLQKELDHFRNSASRAIEETYELLGSVGGDVAKKAAAIAQQSARIEQESKKISLQGWVLSRIGLLVIVGAAIGGGAMQVALWHFAHRAEPASVLKPAR